MAFLCIIHLVLCTWNKIKTCSFLFSVLLPPPCILHFLFSFNTLPLYLLLDNKGWMNQLVICHSLHKKGKKKNLMVSNSFSYQTEDNFFFLHPWLLCCKRCLTFFSLSVFEWVLQVTTWWRVQLTTRDLIWNRKMVVNILQNIRV